MDRGAWWATVHRVEKSQMGLNDFDFHFWGFPGSSAGKESTCNAGAPGWIPELGRSLGEGIDYPLQCSCLENSMDRGAWQATVHGITKSQTRLCD